MWLLWRLALDSCCTLLCGKIRPCCQLLGQRLGTKGGVPRLHWVSPYMSECLQGLAILYLGARRSLIILAALLGRSL